MSTSIQEAGVVIDHRPTRSGLGEVFVTVDGDHGQVDILAALEALEDVVTRLVDGVVALVVALDVARSRVEDQEASQ